MNIGFLGAGAFALALADIANRNGHKVTIWSKFKEEKEELESNRVSKNLKGYNIPEEIYFTNDLEKVMNNDVIFFAVPAEFIEQTAEEIKPYINNQHFCIASKGMHNSKPLCDIIKRILNINNICVISGPTFAVDIIKRIPIGFTLATDNEKTRKIVSTVLKNELVALDQSKDMIGTSICGSVKNIIAIASGIIRGLNLPISTQSLLITKATYEMKEIINFFNGDEKTITSLAGVGDLILTCTSEKSRNFTFGYMIGSKKPKEEIENYKNNTTIEGISAINSIEKLITKENLNIPIIHYIYDMIYSNTHIKELLEIIAK